MRTFFIVVLTGVAGLVLGFFFGDIVARAQGISSFEGKRGYAVLFLMAPMGGLLGLVVGFIASRVFTAPGIAGFLTAQGVALLATATIAGGTAAFKVWQAPKVPLLDGQRLTLEYEIRMAPGRTKPDSEGPDFSVVLVSNGDAARRVGEDLRKKRSTTSEGRVVVPGSLPLNVATKRRSMAFNDGEKAYWFDLPLQAKPTSSDSVWIDWFPKPGESASTDIRGTSGFQLRYRVVKTATQ